MSSKIQKDERFAQKDKEQIYCSSHLSTKKRLMLHLSTLTKANVLMVFILTALFSSFQSCTEKDLRTSNDIWGITKINSLSNSRKKFPELDNPSLSYKHEMYLVKGWKKLSEKEVILKLDSFVKDSFARDLKDYDSYQILFIGKSYKSNLADLEKFSENLFNDHSSEKDMLATYQWRKGEFYQKEYAYRGTRYPSIVEKGQ